MSEFNNFLNEQLQDTEFRKEWDNIRKEVLEAMEEAKNISRNLDTKSYGSFAETLEDNQNRVGTEKSLFGILPLNAGLDDARAERLESK